ncbi:FAD-dependent oxidoreductase, partial [Chloroflexota bacterium]
KYAEAARRAKQAGFDAVEISGSAGYLVNQFLSPVTNQRQDKYGGSFQNRLRFLMEIIESTREKVGHEFPLIYRSCGSDFMEGGLTPDDYKVIAREAERAGVHAIGVTGGWHEAPVPEITMHVPRGGYVYLAQGLKEAVNIPVIACNRINEPLLAEEILRQRKADLIGMGRALLADPELPNKAQSGRFEDIRICIACNQGCLDNLFMRKPIQCLVNAQAGCEREYEIKPVKRKKRVAVIGGGPAGMEAARVAALRGHQVTLYEKGDSLGGLLKLASLPPGKAEIENTVRYLSTQIMKSGVDIRLGTEATRDMIREAKFDAVVEATGAVPIVPDIPGIDSRQVVTAQDVLRDRVTVREKVVIVGGGSVGCDVALFLAHQRAMTDDNAFFLIKYGADHEATLALLKKAGGSITIVEKLPRIGKDIGVTTKWIVLGQLEQYGIRGITGTDVKQVLEGGIVVEKDGNQSRLEADTVVLAAGYLPRESLFRQSEGRQGEPELYAIGDCVEPRKALDAIHEGFRIGQKI